MSFDEKLLNQVLERIKQGLVIGIDPDLHKNGVAILKEGEVLELKGLSLFQLVDFIRANKDEAVFMLEDVNANKSLYAKHNQKNHAVQKRIAQNVGQVKAIAKQIENALSDIGATYVMVRPLAGGLKKAKTDKALFEQLTGWKGKSNQDTRDAAIIAKFGPMYKNLWRLPA